MDRVILKPLPNGCPNVSGLGTSRSTPAAGGGRGPRGKLLDLKRPGATAVPGANHAINRVSPGAECFATPKAPEPV